MQLKELSTERRNRATQNLDQMSALDIVTTMNHEDAAVPRAIRQVLPAIAQAVDRVAECFSKSGRLIYVGSGTSGRIGALDASEALPTFGTGPGMVQFLIAGGERALTMATEACEDSVELGRADMARKKPGKRDVVVGIAASGITPYTISALQYAKSKGAGTIAVACNRNSPLGDVADIRIEVEVGPEVLTGSSRLKAGTAQKLICNMLTTGAMAKMGYVYGNLMVNLHLKNNKLLHRGVLILESLVDVDSETAMETLKEAGMSVPIALIMLKSHVRKTEAARRLRKAKGNVRTAIEG
jgi:N-acetylmuramic acid 6-phosphate etherase